jgi:YggT family protein
VETVITSGLFSTLNIYNTLLIGRLILTWCVAFVRRGATGKPTIADSF